MPSFITRVELHSGTPEDYQALDAAMESVGFSRIVPSDDGSAVYLPTGQYLGTCEAPAAQVSQLAQGAALSIKKGFAVFVSDVTTAAWYGLDPVQPAVTAA